MEANRLEHAKRFIKEQLECRDRGEKEDVLRYNQASYLKLMFDPDTKWVRDHIKGSETTVNLVRNQRKVSGFVDSCIDSIAIEYEKDLRIPSIFEEGYRQVKEYCASLIREGVDINMIIGVLSDTLSWHIYEIVPSEQLQQSEYNENNIELKEIDSLYIKDASDNSANSLLKFLPKYLGREASRFVSGTNLAKDFGLSSEYSQTYINAISDYIVRAINDNPTYYQMVQSLWQNFVEGIDRSDNVQDIYISEYYISNLGKLLCANFIEKKAILSNDEELIQIISGKFFENRGFLNFVEYDYFGWLNTNDNLQKILPVFHKIQQELIVYNFEVAPQEDLFGTIMVQMSQRSQRLLLGQELTPQWLAKQVVNHVRELQVNEEYPCYLDMCCGSGSMIIETLKSVIESLSGTDDINVIKKVLVQAATGFDIDPLAVILAKINWIITVRDIFDQYSITDVSIPIYHADSLFINTPVTSGSVYQQDVLRLTMHDKSVDLPSFVISPDNQALFDKIIDTCYENIHGELLKDAIIEELVNNIIASIRPTLLDDEKEQLICFTQGFYKNLFDLNMRGQNGLWSFLVKNSFRPSLISANFNGIVSNTPWLAMSKISSNPYRMQLTSMANHYNINPSGSSFLHLEMATVFLIHAVDKFLMSEAPFGCILPETILAGKHHEKLRAGAYTIDLDIDELWSLPNDTFKNRAIVVFGRKHCFTEKNHINGKILLSPNQVENTLFNVFVGIGRTAWSLNDLSSGQGLYDDYSFKQGADILPRYLLFFDLKSKANKYEVRSLNDQSSYAYFLQNMHVGKDYKLPMSIADKNLFKPVLVSNIISPFVILELPKAFLPITKNRDNRWRELTTDEKVLLGRTNNNLMSTIQHEFDKFKGQTSASFFDAINIYGKLEKQNWHNNGYLVVYGSGGGKVCAAYLNLSNFESIPIVDQTLYWYYTTDENEAIFLSALLNSNLLTNSISAFQPKGRFGARHIHTLPTSYLPKYDNNNESHNTIVESTKQLVNDLIDVLNESPYLNPNIGQLSSRRKKTKEILERLPSYKKYEESCEAIL